jgi:hypothetical protein
MLSDTRCALDIPIALNNHMLFLGHVFTRHLICIFL